MSTEEQRTKWRAIYYNNRERILLQQYKYRQERKERIKIFNKQYHATHPTTNEKRTHEQELAHNYVQRHRTMLLKTECEICGSTERLEAHHPDYSFASVVVTLCKSCHMWADKGVLLLEQ